MHNKCYFGASGWVAVAGAPQAKAENLPRAEAKAAGAWARPAPGPDPKPALGPSRARAQAAPGRKPGPAPSRASYFLRLRGSHTGTHSYY